MNGPRMDPMTEARFMYGPRDELHEPNEWDRRWLSGFTVFLGSHSNFDHWGNPDTGWTAYVGVKGCATGSFGDRFYWRSVRSLPCRADSVLTDAGAAW